MTLASRSWPVRLNHGPVVLRPLRRRDEAAWNDIRTRGAAWFRQWDSTRPPDSVDENLTFRQMVSRFNSRARSGQMLPWAVEYHPEPQATGLFVGQVTVSGIVRGSASWAQIGYWIDQRWAGRRVIPTAVAMAGDYCFQTLRLHRLEIAIRPENTNSLAVVRKLGFRYEGRRPRYMHVDGDWRDHDVFVLHAEEVPEGLLRRLEHPTNKG